MQFFLKLILYQPILGRLKTILIKNLSNINNRIGVILINYNFNILSYLIHKNFILEFENTFIETYSFNLYINLSGTM